MKLILLLVVQLTLMQNTAAKEQCIMKTNDADTSTNLEKTTYGLPSVLTLWKKIKELGNLAQKTINDIGDSAIKKLYALMIGLRNSIEALINLLITQLEYVKDEVYNAIWTAWETAGDIKECIMKDKDAIRGLVKKIINRVISCIIKKVKKTIFSACQSKTSCSSKEFQTINKTEFMKGAIDKINRCVENDKEEEVGSVVNVIMKMANMKSTIRDLTSNVLEILLQCTSEGILDVSAAIADEVQNIYNNVMDKRAKSLDQKVEL